MTGVLIVAETRRGELRDISLELIGAAGVIRERAGGRVTVAILDRRPERYVSAVSMVGVDEVLLVPTPTEEFEAFAAARALEALIEAEDPTVVLLGHTIDAMGVGPAVAARSGLGFASDVTAIAWDGELVAWRGAYGEKLRRRLEFPRKRCVLLMVRGGTFEPESGVGLPATRSFESPLDGVPAAEHVCFREAESSGVDITKAPFLVSMGRGVEDEEQLERFEALADRLSATWSVSRPLVDAGWASSARQVGQSGKTVKPRIYLALGISGAVQHLAGIRSAETIIAVNTDPEAPIFGVADYGVVTDMFAFADALEQQLG
jgi:electron transfer flavoprotein alpha subunit